MKTKQLTTALYKKVHTDVITKCFRTRCYTGALIRDLIDEML